MGQTVVTVQDNGSTVVTLDQQTVARINANRPQTVVGGSGGTTVGAQSSAVAVEGGTTVVAGGAAMGVQGPQGEPGLSGGGTIPPVAFSYGDAAGTIYTPGDAGTLTTARVVITTPFDGAGAALILGTVGDPDGIMPATDNDPTEAGEYEATADFPLAAGEGIRLTITPGAGASQGAGLIYLEFIPD